MSIQVGSTDINNFFGLHGTPYIKHADKIQQIKDIRTSTFVFKN